MVNEDNDSSRSEDAQYTPQQATAPGATGDPRTTDAIAALVVEWRVRAEGAFHCADIQRVLGNHLSQTFFEGQASAYGYAAEELTAAAINATALLAQRDELLAACRAFVAAYEKSHQLEKTDTAMRLARAAIAKCEGREP